MQTCQLVVVLFHSGKNGIYVPFFIAQGDPEVCNFTEHEWRYARVNALYQCYRSSIHSGRYTGNFRSLIQTYSQNLILSVEIHV
jgi:hypothetical protein